MRITLLFIVSLTTVAAFLIGVNVGKRVASEEIKLATLIPTSTNISSTLSLSITPISPTISSEGVKQFNQETSTYTDSSCNFSFTHSSSYIKSETKNNTTVIYLNPNNSDEKIATVCQKDIPRPPLEEAQIENITIDGVAAKLYHDKDTKDGKPRDEVIVKIPGRDLELFLAGYGPTFNEIIGRIKFLPL